MRRIDLHTHVFNVRYLPVAGILHQRGHLPTVVARGIAKLLNWRTGDEIGHGGAGLQDLRLQAAEARHGEEALARPARALAASTQPELIDDPDVREALAMISATPAPELFKILSAHVSSADVQTQFEQLYAQVENADRDSIFDTGVEYLNWFKFLTHSEQFIVDRLLDTYGNDVEIFVHHMMDLEHYYDPGDCHYDFVGQQLDRMRRLVNANKGRLLTFVAWSPKRPNAINVVRRAVEDGIATGIKVYPPSGYRADEAMNDPLFDFSVEKDVPLFAHCSPVGFEARPGYGQRSAPSYWRNVLHRPDKPWKSLRLCLAHAGGENPWFGLEGWSGFAQDAVALAVAADTPNVYLEFGYHDHILEPDRREAFASRLAHEIEASGGRLGDRIVYGPDWHMIERLPNHEKYFEAFSQLFSKPPLDQYADRFFYRNAATFLNLPAFAQRRAEEDPVRAHVEKVWAAARPRQ